MSSRTEALRDNSGDPGAMGSATPTCRFKFGDFEVDTRAGELRRGESKIKLHRKSLQLLLVLLEHPGEVVLREELRANLWTADTFVDFNANIKTAVNKLRQALNDSAEKPIFIETIPRVGYRFIFPVTHLLQSSHLSPATGPLQRVEDHLPRASWTAGIIGRNRFWRIAALSVLCFALGVSGLYEVWQRSSHVKSSSIPRSPVLLVLPFDNLSGDSSQDFFSDGETDEMISLIGRQAPHDLSVIARTSAMQYRGVHKPLSRIAQELGGVDYVLEGSVRRFGAHIALNTELLRMPGQVVLWSHSYERDIGDLLEVQQDLAEQVCSSVLRRLMISKSTHFAGAVNSQAHDTYLMGMYYQANKRNGDNLLRGIEYFKQAVQQDSHYAPAYAALAYSYTLAAGWEVLPPTTPIRKRKRQRH